MARDGGNQRDDLERMESLKRTVESLQKKHDRAEGAIEQLMEELRSEFDVSSLKEAKQMRSRVAGDKGELEAKFSKLLFKLENEVEKR